jgi:predicted DNA-binding ribbon-helix-helix protein
MHSSSLFVRRQLSFSCLRKSIEETVELKPTFASAPKVLCLQWSRERRNRLHSDVIPT